MTEKQNSVFNKLQEEQRKIFHEMLDQPSKLIQQPHKDKNNMSGLIESPVAKALGSIESPVAKAKDAFQQIEEDRMMMFHNQQAKLEEDKQFFQKLIDTPFPVKNYTLRRFAPQR